MNKPRSKSIRDQLRAIEGILRAWDPIGVIINPNDRLDEHDAYAPAILAKLHAGVDAEALAQHPHGLARRELGVLGGTDRELDFAQTLLAWWARECKENPKSQSAP